MTLLIWCLTPMVTQRQVLLHKKVGQKWSTVSFGHRGNRGDCVKLSQNDTVTLYPECKTTQVNMVKTIFSSAT